MRGDITGNMLAGMVNSNTGAGANTLFNIAQNGNGAGDAYIQTQISGAGGSTTSFGIDNSDGNKFKISPTGNVPGENANASFVATNDATPRYGFNIDAPSYEVDIAKQARSKQWINVLAKPTVGALGTGLGTAPTINDISGSNNGFSITFTTGTAPVANGELFQVTYNTTFPAFAIPVFSQGSARTADDFLKFYSNNLDGAGFKMTANGTLQATKQYVLNFAVTGF